MELNNEMTAQKSLQLISETLNNSRRSILSNGAKYFILWGSLLVIFSLAIYFLWHTTGNPRWNLLWFVMPAIGFPISFCLRKKDVHVPESFVGNMISHAWKIYCVFAVSISVIAVLLVPMFLSFAIVLILGMTMCFTGALLKSWIIIIGGFILGVGGAAATMLIMSDAELLLFTVGGLLLLAIGLIEKHQNK